MASKDWRLVDNKNDFKQWFNDRTRVSVFVYHQDYIPELKKESHWTFEVSKWIKILEKNTKTKSGALRLAKAFMRNH